MHRSPQPSVCSHTSGPMHGCRNKLYTHPERMCTRTHAGAHTGRSKLQEISLVRVSFPSPHRGLCLEDSWPRRRLLGLEGTGSPDVTIDFCLSLSIRMGSSDREPVRSGGGPARGKPGADGVEREKGLPGQGAAKRSRHPCSQNPALKVRGGRDCARPGVGGSPWT